jgi:hypothetical protein
MTKLTSIEGRPLEVVPLVSLDELPQRRAEERLEDLARELVTVTAMLCSAELRGSLCEAQTVERASREELKYSAIALLLSFSYQNERLLLPFVVSRPRKVPPKQ